MAVSTIFTACLKLLIEPIWAHPKPSIVILSPVLPSFLFSSVFSNPIKLAPIIVAPVFLMNSLRVNLI